MRPKKQKQPNKQEIAFRYIAENLLDYGRLRHDLISDQVQIQNVDGTWRDFLTKDINDIVCDCSRVTGVAISAKEVQAVVVSNNVPSVHPLREYVQACGGNPILYDPYKPDNVDWIDWLAQRVTVEGDEQDQLFWRDCFKKWFVAMVASWLDPDVVNHQVLIFIGEQGIGKTTWLDYLLPPELRMYGSKMGNNAYLSKDDKLRVAEYGLINIDEIDAMGTRELNAMKSLITTTDIHERPAYRYNKEKRTHIASFCASGNKKEFLNDLTGNRRWLPFYVTHIEDPREINLPYENIYAQAYYLFTHNFQYWFEQEENKLIDQHNEDFRDRANEEQLITQFFAVPAAGTGTFMTAADISGYLKNAGSITKPMPLNKLGIIIKRMGFPEVRKGQNRTKGYLVYPIPQADVTKNRENLNDIEQ